MLWPKILLYCDRAPGMSGVGQLFLKELCDGIPPEKLAFCTMEQSSEAHDSRFFSAVRRKHLSSALNMPHRQGSPIISALKRHLSFRCQARTWGKNTVEAALRFAEDEGAELVWAVLSSPVIWYTARHVASRLGTPLVSTVWDPPEGVGQHYQMDRFSRKVAKREFEETLICSDRIGVISERMKEEYHRLCKESYVLRHGIAESDFRPAKSVCVDKEFRIGFCGSLYAEDEWKTLLNALDSLDWRLAGVPVRLVVAGAKVPYLASRRPATVEYFGWRPVSDVIELMSHCHMLYLPYWFNPAFSDSVRLCFPTKLTSYLTSGRPVIYHGPLDSEVTRFFERFEVGRCCHSPETDQLVASLSSFAAEIASVTEEFTSGINKAVQEELNLSVFRSRFRQMIQG